MDLTHEEQKVYDKIDDIINLINFKDFFTPIDIMFILQHKSRGYVYQLVKENKIETCKNSDIIKKFELMYKNIKYVFSKKNVLDFINTYKLFNKFKYEIFDCLYAYDEHIYQNTNEIYLDDLIKTKGDIYSNSYISKYLFIKDVKEALNILLNMLPERERNVIILRFGIGDSKLRTLEEVGKIFGCGKERIRQIEVKALRKLRLFVFVQHYYFNKCDENIKIKQIKSKKVLNDLRDYLYNYDLII